jgi:5-methylcytosine-specific restriction endonuclease McrA
VRVFVLGMNGQPLDPCHPARARKLLRAGRAAVFRRHPFTIILKDREITNSVVHLHRVKLDPGSRTTGIALVNDDTGTVVWGAEIEHRGALIHLRMTARAALRRGRRHRHTRHRAPRFLNRHPAPCVVCGKNARHGHKTCSLHARVRPENSAVARRLPPSLESRVANVETWTKRLCRLAPVSAISMELVRFDLQKVEHPEIQGVDYQQGDLVGYEVKEYLLLKFGHKCAYCGGLSEDPVLEVEHMTPRSRGGTNRVSNLVIACHTCNQTKGKRTPEEWAEVLRRSRKEIDLTRIANCGRVRAQAKAPLRDAAAVNATRWVLWHRLSKLGLPVETGSGGLTKFNRTRLGLPKQHWLDAACVGVSTPEGLWVEDGPILRVKATGHGKRQRCGTDKHGFPIRHAPRAKRFFGFQTGDFVRAVVPKGKLAGTHFGRIAARRTGSFRVGDADGVSWRHCRLIQRADGFEYAPSYPWLNLRTSEAKGA